MTREANRSVLFIRQRRRESAGLGLITCNIYSSAAPKLTNERSNPLGLYLLMCEVGGGGGVRCVRECVCVREKENESDRERKNGSSIYLLVRACVRA